MWSSKARCVFGGNWKEFSAAKRLLRWTSTVSSKDEEVNAYSWRSHTCGELRADDVGRRVLLCGWVQYVRMNSFITLRDAYGSTQIIANNHKELLSNLPLESVLMVEGKVIRRPEGQTNKNMETGEVEIAATDVQVLNPACDNPPFSIRNHNKANETLRMKHRYLDLRFPEMQRNLRLRSRLFADMRRFLVDRRDFVEVETPTLFRKTPGGAQEFVVPTQKAGMFFSLVQSPQQLKQLLMVGGIDRYFQIARCYRDETSRPDRQPEFTQLDIELSFTDSEGVIKLVEDLLSASLPSFVGVSGHFDRISLSDAMKLYGTDQPDLTMAPQLEDLHVAEGDPVIRALVIPTAAALLSNSERTSILKNAKTFPSCRILTLKFPGSDWEKQLAKLGVDLRMDDLKKSLNLREGDLVYIASDASYKNCSKLLGKLRIDTIKLLRSKNLAGSWDSPGPKFRFVWVEEFPLFELEDDGSLSSTHHPFTAPHPEDVRLLDEQPLRVRGLHYDLVLNGWEIGGGSVRIHNADLQLHILQDILRIDPTSLQHMLTALGSGAPPHAGIALGLDRLMSILVEAPSIRDVIAFPKTAEGHDLLSGSPSTVGDEDLKLYHIKVDKQDDKSTPGRIELKGGYQK
ncbi:Hypothetical protein NTJ_13263 [Nesidiocoris tenuis]|uniref:Aminoacyl-transfer RNA synthetases class-II family profile domain-containing protein n=1 Tax=Nesidiocoris tenuis TaxID=355587 RepID=A0ABN7B7T4_9HEMI|nr:Hypothetical protein NTJ_13263 [Nesidiocoris tenuis]